MADLDATPAAPHATDPPATAPAVVRDPRRLAAGGLTMLLVAVVAAGAFWMFLENFKPIFEVSEKVRTMSEETPAAAAEKRYVHFANSLVSFAVMGAAFAGLAALVEGVLRRSVGWAILGCVAGAILGAAFGAGAGWTAHAIYDVHLSGVDPLMKTMLMQGCAWAVLGVGFGLAVGLPTRSARTVVRTILGAVVGGIAAAMVYGFGAAILFPMHSTDRVIPTGFGNRLFWAALTLGLMGLVAGWQGAAAPTRPRTTT